jgi:hypothetical protein
MYWRLAVGGVAWLALLLLFAAALQQPRQPPGLPPPEGAPALVRTLNAPQFGSGRGRWSWRVTRATSAHHVMLVEVEAERVADARAIAVQVIEPVRHRRYDEILVYVRAAGSPPGAAARRVQWTPHGSMTELVFRD